MGAVYEAFDSEHNKRIALKTLREWRSDTLLRFKNEFRNFQHFDHPNLVSLGELYHDNGQWFFTMELVNGIDCLTYVRPSSARTYDEHRLRETLVQLSRGLMAIHSDKKLHRDIKPSNVLVTAMGRVVILDFGLAKDLEPTGQNISVSIVGTPVYMAPEQAVTTHIGPAADWYSVGVLLYHALTGRVPFSGPIGRMLERKQSTIPPPPSAHARNIPNDLDELCMNLLATNPDDRADGAAVISVAGRFPLPSSGVTHARLESSVFVGRHQELDRFHRMFKEVQTLGQCRTVHVCGESGVGKSTVVHQFLSQVRTRVPNLLVLTGRCREQETIPYNAIDSVVDDLSRYLTRLPTHVQRELLRCNAEALAVAFPVLSRVDAIGELPILSIPDDLQELRTRVFSSFRDLFTKLVARTPTVVFIDDLQWTDNDSLAILGELLRPPNAPAILFVCAIRTEMKPLPILPGEGFMMSLPRLSNEESRILVKHFVNSGKMASEADVDAIIDEGKGHPLFVQEIVHHRLDPSRGASTEIPPLLEVIWGRICGLSEESKRLLEVIALASAPLTHSAVIRAANVDPIDGARHIKSLKASRLIRSAGGVESINFVESYHDQVRESVHRYVGHDTFTQVHRNIALVLEELSQMTKAQPNILDALVVHWTEAGERAKAAECAMIAAKRAIDTLAFDRAVQLFDKTLEFKGSDAADRRDIQLRLAEALVLAGQGVRAASVYLELARGTAFLDAIRLRFLAADQLLRCGRVDEGVEHIERSFARRKSILPKSRFSALISFFLTRLRLRMRGLSFRARQDSRIPSAQLGKLDIYESLMVAFFTVDYFRGHGFQSRYLLLAQSEGDSKRVAFGLTFEVVRDASVHGSLTAWGRHAIQQARTLTLVSADERTKAFLFVVDGAVAFFSGRWREGYDLTAQGTVRLAECGTRCSWEIAVSHLVSISTLCQLGDIRTLTELIEKHLAKAKHNGNLYSVINYCSGFANIVWLARDEPVPARKETHDAITKWSQQGFHLQHFFDVIAQTQIDFYEDDYFAAYARVAVAVREIGRTTLSRVKLNRILIADLEARSILGWAAVNIAKNRNLLRVASVRIRRLRSENSAWATALADMLEAGLAFLQGRRQNALQKLHLALTGFDQLGMKLHKASAEACNTWLGGTEQGNVLQTRTDDYFASEQIARPERIVMIFAPWARSLLGDHVGASQEPDRPIAYRPNFTCSTCFGSALRFLEREHALRRTRRRSRRSRAFLLGPPDSRPIL